MRSQSPERILEEYLVLQAQDGDERAVEELINSLTPKLFNYAMRTTKDADAANDALQETWLVALRSLQKLKDPASFRGWIFRILNNKCADYVRRQQSSRKVEQELHRDGEPTSEPLMPSDEVDDIEMLRKAMESLRDDRRQILELHYLRELSIVEISGIINVPTGTVKSRLHHARLELKKKMNRMRG